MTAKKSTRKETLSARVPKATKEKYDKKAQEKGVSTSEHLASVLVEYDKQKERIEWLEKQLDERNEQTNRLQSSLDKEQERVAEAHKLQTNAETRNRELNLKYIEMLDEQKQLVADVTEEKNKGFFDRLFNRS